MRYKIERLSLPALANPRFASLSLSEINKRGCRTIGGDKGDLEFFGFHRENNETVLDRPELVTGLELTADEAAEIAREVLEFSYESIGIETVEHS